MQLRGACVVVLVIVSGLSDVTAASAAVDAMVCSEIAGPTDRKDYRLRQSSEEMRRQYDDNWKNHVAPALKRAETGDISRRAKSSLHWTLSRWPNHMVVLKLLVDYDLAGGRQYEFPPTECYFYNARMFAPDDLSVLMAEAYWLLKKSKSDRAISVYEEVLAKDPNLPEAHYNIALAYLEREQFSRANYHAQRAYELGYPLPGLREKLVKSGHWDPGIKRAPQASQ